MCIYIHTSIHARAQTHNVYNKYIILYIYIIYVYKPIYRDISCLGSFSLFAYCSSLLFLVGPSDVPNTFASFLRRIVPRSSFEEASSIIGFLILTLSLLRLPTFFITFLYKTHISINSSMFTGRSD